MKIITQKRINKTVDELIDAVFDHTDFDIEVNGHQDYDIIPDISKTNRPIVAQLLYDILTDKKPRKWWKLTNVAVRRQK